MVFSLAQLLLPCLLFIPPLPAPSHNEIMLRLSTPINHGCQPPSKFPSNSTKADGPRHHFERDRRRRWSGAPRNGCADQECEVKTDRRLQNGSPADPRAERSTLTPPLAGLIWRDESGHIQGSPIEEPRHPTTHAVSRLNLRDAPI
nr:hypothetical protein Itr_chr10CG10430 [Ipomoea trifida]